MKRFVSLALSFIILFCFMPSFAGNAETVTISIGGTDDESGNWYATFGDAMENLQANGNYEIVVKATVSESKTVVFPAGSTVTITRAADDVNILAASGFTDNLFMMDSKCNVTFDGVFIGGNPNVSAGKLIYVKDSVLSLKDTTLNGNYGGGIYMESDAVVNMISGTISNCGGDTVFGAGIHVVSGVFNMLDGTITKNVALYGGGIYVMGENSVANLNGGSIINNTAQYGGGVYVDRGTVNICGTEIVLNSAQYYGGGICNCGIGYVLYAKDDIKGIIDYSAGKISGNIAKYGSGVYLNCQTYVSKPGAVFSSPPLTVSNCLAISNGAVIDLDNDVFLAGKEMSPSIGDEGAFIIFKSAYTTPAARITPASYTEGLKVTEGSDSVTVTPYDDEHEVSVKNGLISISEKVFIPGDVDLSGKVTVADALMTLRVAAKLTTADDSKFKIMDIDKDNLITVADALAILRICVGLVK